MMPNSKTSQPTEYRVIADVVVNGKVKGEIVTFDDTTIAILPLLAGGHIERVTDSTTQEV